MNVTARKLVLIQVWTWIGAFLWGLVSFVHCRNRGRPWGGGGQTAVCDLRQSNVANLLEVHIVLEHRNRSLSWCEINPNVFFVNHRLWTMAKEANSREVVSISERINTTIEDSVDIQYLPTIEEIYTKRSFQILSQTLSSICKHINLKWIFFKHISRTIKNKRTSWLNSVRTLYFCCVKCKQWISVFKWKTAQILKLRNAQMNLEWWHLKKVVHVFLSVASALLSITL